MKKYCSKISVFVLLLASVVAAMGQCKPAFAPDEMENVLYGPLTTGH